MSQNLPLSPSLYKLFPGSHSRSLGLLSPICLDSSLGALRYTACSFTHNPVSVDWLYQEQAGGPKFVLVTHALYMFKELTHVLQTSVVMLLLLLLLSHFSRV